ncbi:hypothetical protein [Roseicyclus mahoneyensis]|jgi:hypothetical protein|uniref:Lipoprotein n=1 Tax=Roseicyclus mahoneyensis TaxID=164332 RepID=A0A316GPC8_9RHOB|nr:hypothetical protein [Roseicyclus mahoneyensis]PWK62221.1 hypothetical protein C7455_101247 [Roseicyclus mahoneyensis]
MLRVTLALALILSLAACGSRLNPFNWFGGDREERIVAREVVETTPGDQRQLVAEVVDLAVDPTPQGAIVRAMGRPPVQGFWEAELVEVERTEGAIVYEFRVFPPLSQTREGTPQSREVVVAANLSNFDLSGIRTVTVIGAQNRRTVSRR